MARTEWYGLHVFIVFIDVFVLEFEFFQHLNQFYGAITEVCTNKNCPRYSLFDKFRSDNFKSMSAGPG